ncbi:MAG: sigma-70 family RNA polymerase sigma factor [Flavipsychrobacter sp.]|nr:sigma-70 family RNA polymerase sigma factor [Flavipsychrobacter sp.]
MLQLHRRSSDNQVLGHLLQRYTLLLLGVGMKYLKDKDEAQDAVQQVFMKALTHLPEGEILNFKGWLYVLMRNHCLQQLRGTTYKADEEVLNHVSEAPGPDKEELMAQEYTLAQMNEAIQELSSEQKVSVVSFYLEKMSYQQIMEKTGFTFTQVKSYIQNGKRNLKILLLRKMGKQ